MQIQSMIKGIIFILFLFKPTLQYSQVISNMSFEGKTQTNVPPIGWHPCNEFSTPDTQPGSWEVSTPASHGNSYIGLVTRGNLGPYANQNEGVGTELLISLSKDKTFTITFDLAYSTTWGHSIDFGPFLSYDNPAKLRMFGGLTPCDKLELLWESPVIDHTEWKSYSATFKPEISDVNYVVLEAAYANGSSYFGNILADNLSIDICSIAEPIETKGFDSLICELDSLIINASTPGGAYHWNNGSAESSILVTSAGKFTVEVSNGCDTQTFDYVIQEKECNCEITFPNVFTPNGDGLNDYFEINGTRDIARFNLKIFNRWGTLVYESNDIEKYWNGEISGKEPTTGVYFLAVSIMCINGQSINENSYKGQVTILR